MTLSTLRIVDARRQDSEQKSVEHSRGAKSPVASAVIRQHRGARGKCAESDGAHVRPKEDALAGDRSVRSKRAHWSRVQRINRAIGLLHVGNRAAGARRLQSQYGATARQQAPPRLFIGLAPTTDDHIRPATDRAR